MIRDGRSLLDESWTRERVLIEAWTRNNNESYSVPPWSGFYSPDLEYVEYYEVIGGLPTFREYYALDTDPYQLLNLLGDRDPLNDPDVTQMSLDLRAASSCVGPEECP